MQLKFPTQIETFSCLFRPGLGLFLYLTIFHAFVSFSQGVKIFIGLTPDVKKMLEIVVQVYHFFIGRILSNSLKWLAQEYILTVLFVNRTTSAPKSVLHYSLDKVQYFSLEISLHPLLFPNKKTVTHHRVKLFIELKRKVEHSANHHRHPVL